MQSFRLIPAKATLLAVFLVATDKAFADPLTFYFSGNVNFVHESLELDESVHVGAAFSGGYSFEPSRATDSYPNDPRVGNYYFGPPARIWAQIGNYEFVSNDLIMYITNDLLSGDVYEPITVTPFAAAGYQWSIMAVLLNDDSGAALDSDALPTGVPDLADFPTSAGFGIYLPGDDLGIAGTLTSLTPEPSSLCVLSLGSIALLARRRRG